ncbi:hypothetical protein [Leifsonia sp. 1010]|uniref:hypothetical protein n=1 Tax=Leifsonia sp. 1010 TaxID=2817769 RepID=UPI00285538C6|nr:hypothetical protein [Leifsonia sp. 1010]MDR6611927.1 hypothetical protein [Leifsonia sp. 1010]
MSSSRPGPTAMREERRAESLVMGGALGFASGVIGLLPWLLKGGRLPLQNLWQTETRPDAMPYALLPVSQYSATTLLVLLLVGGVVAGGATRLLRRTGRVEAWSVSVGLLLLQVAALLQAFIVVADGLGIGRPGVDSRSLLYFTGMLGGTIVSVMLAQALFWLISRRSVGPAALGLVLAAVPVTSWIVGAITAVVDPYAAALVIGSVFRWLPAVIVGAVLGWCGVVPLRRLGVWVAGLAALWVTPALFTAVSNALGMRVLDGDLREMAQIAVKIFPAVLDIGVGPVILAALLGAAIVVVRWAVARGGRRSEALADPDA